MSDSLAFPFYQEVIHSLVKELELEGNLDSQAAGQGNHNYQDRQG